ncbi:NAD(P)/FAD-dependent oxidoreductase [Sporosarcina sp. PTS2304]|uniref:NAD(P)/FAD-dependent oxidoreductase n=1 Tax=Sporosarcina sp. PTS2304 TaxID=2283194 RepID=UPI000E0D0C19|nr:NAD(P)/FAD-dependent oxidoreductase [Sporosarcina sp. PTS2304]AXI00228.1 NAD(P)/FAD-dependent oxidoreductase [Sporosarcina sp. PTS2304]
MYEKDEVFDITIIGGGPVGLFTAFYAGLRQARVKIIESLPQLGGQLSALYPEKHIYDVAGFPKITGKELIDNLTEQMNQFDPAVVLNEAVETLERQPDGVFKILTNNSVHFSKTIIITAGNGAFNPRKLGIDTADKYEGENLHYFVNDMQQFAGKKVQLFGGGDSAVDWALMLEPIAEEVILTHRREKFRAHEHSVELLKNSKVKIMTPYVPQEFIGETQIEHVVLEHVKGEGTKSIEVDDVIVNYGFISQLGPIKEWGLEIEKNSIVVNSKMETNIAGIYAAGDICTYEGKVKLIATGFGEAPTAVSNAKVYIDPSSKVQAPHSTSVMDKSEEKIVSVTL